MDKTSKLRILVVVAATLAVAATVLVFVFFPPDLNGTWLRAFGVLISLGLLSIILALRVTERGTTASVDFLPELAAVLLLGPAGSVALTAISDMGSQLLVDRKPILKSIFNTSQVVLAIAAASVTYIALGGHVGATLSALSLDFERVFLPFLGASVVYFMVNSTAVGYAIALSEGKSFRDVWGALAGKSILFDIAISPLAYLVAYLYLKLGIVALYLAVVPIIGLRYSYGLNIELQQLNFDLLRVLIRALEAQDPYTSGHSIRVAERARRIAKQLGLARRRIEIVETAALLHDIGKIGVEFGKILRQKGPLTPEQRDLIRSHPRRGVEIIKSVRSLHQQVLDCVLHHHERIDGTGYPDGLAGEEIPLGARIIMVSDTIDAMLTARPYRDALPVSVVREELLKHRGTQFDSDVVEAALDAEVLTVDAPPSIVAEGAPETPQDTSSLDQPVEANIRQA